MGEEGEQFLAGLGEIPADGAVGKGGDSEAVVGGEVYGPGSARYLPALPSVALVAAQGKVTAEDK